MNRRLTVAGKVKGLRAVSYTHLDVYKRQVQTPAQPEAQAQPADPAPAPQKVEKREASDPLGEPGIKALQAERQAREALERELKPLKDQMDALKGIFGDKRVEGTDIVSALQQQVAQMQRDSLVDRVARRHGITDDADVEFLHNATDEAAMTRLAAPYRTCLLYTSRCV